MKPDQFLLRHGQPWTALKRDPMWKDLLETIRGFDPARSMPAVDSTAATENAAHLLGRITGFNLAVNVIEALKIEETITPPEETWGVEKPE